MAALHYSWKTGSLNDYENTFLHHKGESIRLVNEWLGHPDARTSAACMKLIATLSVTEVQSRISHPPSGKERQPSTDTWY